MMRRRYELTNREWSILSPLPPNKPRWVWIGTELEPPPIKPSNRCIRSPLRR